eukprot:6210474-Pleurochrysis_carterae.AAC.3
MFGPAVSTDRARIRATIGKCQPSDLRPPDRVVAIHARSTVIGARVSNGGARASSGGARACYLLDHNVSLAET